MLASVTSPRRPGRVPGTRELVVPKTGYLAPYRVRRDTVEILFVGTHAQYDRVDVESVNDY